MGKRFQVKFQSNNMRRHLTLANLLTSFLKLEELHVQSQNVVFSIQLRVTSAINGPRIFMRECIHKYI